ncbi:MAG TPA: hypothetical protein VFL12_06230, partial [Thermoanaerobaculia bacterium]|nr:hypothetical protein [Thermoanaerobaculia bacterium]
SGLYGTFAPDGTAANPKDFVIMWDSTDQNGVVQSGIIPGTTNPDPKDEFDLAYDSVSQSLVLVWNDRLQVINSIQFAIFQKGIWVQSQLLPSGVFSFASNPQLLITHQTVQDLDASGNEIDSVRSIISVIWFEGSVRPRARFAPIFVENGSLDLADIQIYDLPELVGSQTIEWPAILGSPLFESPALQQDGMSPMVLATFADVASQTMQVAQIGFPSDFRHVVDPLHGRHVVVILGHNASPILAAVPAETTLLGSVVGSNYQPTVYWQSDPGHVSYAMTDGTQWTAPRSVTLTPTLGADAAVTLIRKMALQN